jgi:alkylation response protein AidB-like acyl-CoA dehydrogenase
MAGLNVERLILAATMLGIGQRAFDDALAYAKERKQFGRPIGNFQALQHRFADLATELAAGAGTREAADVGAALCGAMRGPLGAPRLRPAPARLLHKAQDYRGPD